MVSVLVSTLDEFTLLALHWFKNHPTRIADAADHIPPQYLKASLDLIYYHYLKEESGYYVLTQQALEALAQESVIKRRQDRYNFVMGMVTGIVSTLLLDCLVPFLLRLLTP